MPNDGYFMTREEKFKLYSTNQVKLNSKLQEIVKNISDLPKMPASMDEWINDLPDPSKNKFNMKTFTKQVEIKKEYSKLVEDADINMRALKILAIEDLIDKIAKTLHEADKDTIIE